MQILETEMEGEDIKIANDEAARLADEASRDAAELDVSKSHARFRMLQAQRTEHRENNLVPPLSEVAEAAAVDAEFSRELYSLAVKLRPRGVSENADIVTDAVELANVISWALFTDGQMKIAARTNIATFVAESQRRGELFRLYEEERDRQRKMERREAVS